MRRARSKKRKDKRTRAAPGGHFAVRIADAAAKREARPAKSVARRGSRPAPAKEDREPVTVPSAATTSTALETRRDAAHPMAALLGGVAPLPGPERVARGQGRYGTGRDMKHHDMKHHVAVRASFVLTRDGDRVDGYREDLVPPPLAPGHRQTWVPEVRLDLHGVRARDLDARLASAISSCMKAARVRLLVVHGKGLHSEGGHSVLGEAVLERLTSERHARHVRAFSTAPERLGGSGALAVELERPSK